MEWNHTQNVDLASQLEIFLGWIPDEPVFSVDDIIILRWPFRVVGSLLWKNRIGKGTMDKLKYKLEKLANRKSGFPIATIAYYGPDNQIASKVVVGLKFSEHEKEITHMRKWYSDDQDVRRDRTIINEMLEYIQENQAWRIAMVNRIIGCPHEEGIDYPEGENCPQCPFWANRDRWTGEIIP